MFRYLGNTALTVAPASAQTVARAIQLLRLVASSQSRNLRLVDIAEMADLDKSTAHRLLQRLVQERMLVRDPGLRGYRLGPLLYELGLAALPETNLRQVAQPAVRVELQVGHGRPVVSAGIESQASRMICAASASIAAACLRFAMPCARCAAKRRLASCEVCRSSISCTGRA